jgi:hypothetical protein
MQINNEYKYSKTHLVENIKSMYPMIDGMLEPVITQIQAYFDVHDFSYVLKNGTVKNYDTKQQRYEDMQEMTPEALQRLVWVILAHTIAGQLITFTELLGKLYRRIPHVGDRLQIETAAELIGCMHQSKFLTVIYPRDNEHGVLMVQSNVKQLAGVQDYVEGTRFNLPLLVEPVPLECNSDSGYHTFESSVILSGKHHDMPVNLRHINRMNSIKLFMDERTILNVEPTFKIKSHKTDLENIKRYQQFKQCNTESVKLYAMFAGREFYLTNKFDERGRTYCHGFHFNTQGDDQRKGILELANRELVEC